jgi:hypothetical protein
MNKRTSIRKHENRRWFQISLRAFVLIVLVGSALTGWLASEGVRADRERKIVEYLQQYNAQILYDYQFSNGTFEANGVPNGPQWMRRRLAVHFFSSATSVQIHSPDSLEGIECVQGLRKLERLTIYNCDQLENVDCLRNMPELRYLDLGKCSRLVNVDALKGANKLQHLALNQCLVLENIDSLNLLQELSELELSGCDGLTNFSVLSGLRLRKLDFTKSTLSDVEFLEGLTTLEELYLAGSESLTNVDGLKNLKQLQKLDLRGCDKLKKHQIDSLKDDLPLANIAF